MSWYTLPQEIHYAILEQVVEIAQGHNEPLARYTTVSREWRVFLEGHIFRYLHVTPDDLDKFTAAFKVVRRRKYLQRLGLVLHQHPPIDLCPEANTAEEMALMQMLIINRHGANAYRHLPELRRQQILDNTSFHTGIYSIFRVLATWTQEQVFYAGVAFEIIAESKSYWQRMAERLRRIDGPLVVQMKPLSGRRAKPTERFSPYQFPDRNGKDVLRPPK